MSSPNDITPIERVAFQQLLTLADVDCRGGPGRSMLRCARALASDLGNDLSVAQQMLVQRASLLSLLCTHAESSFLLGRQDVPLADYVSMASTLRRLLTTLSPNLKRVPREVGSLIDLLRDDRASARRAEREAREQEASGSGGGHG
jgi:hypothetical protein